jgi:hypothetical protein
MTPRSKGAGRWQLAAPRSPPLMLRLHGAEIERPLAAMRNGGFSDRCVPNAQLPRRFRAPVVSSTREWPEKWTLAQASKAACGN